MPRSTPIPRRAPADRTLPLVAAAAAAIALAALVAAVLSWLALVGHPPARGGEAIGAALVASRGGLVVDSLRDGGAAMRGGLRVGDVVEAVDGVAAADSAGLDRVAPRGVDLRIRRRDRALIVHLPPNERAPLG